MGEPRQSNGDDVVKGDRKRHLGFREAMQETKRRLQDILDNAAAVIYVKDIEGRFLLINSQYERLFHVASDQIVGKTDYDIFPKEIADAFRGNDLKVIEANRSLEFEEVAPRDDGLHTYISVKFPLYDSRGVAYAVCGISTDITERKRAEKALKESEERFRTLSDNTRLLLESTDQGIYGIDLQARCTLVNRAAAAMVGYEPEDILGKNIHELMHHSRPDGSAYPVDECPIVRAIRIGQGVRVDSEVFWRRDGTSFPVEYSSYPIVEGGITKGAVVTFFDITERKRMEDALRKARDELEMRVQERTEELRRVNEELRAEIAFRQKAEEEYKTILRSAMDGFWITDAQGHLLDVNEAYCRLLGYSRDELLGMRIQDIEAAETPEETARHVQLVIERGSDRFETRHRRKDGTLIDVEVSVNHLPVDSGRLIAFLRDITERKRAETERERLLAELAASRDLIAYNLDAVSRLQEVSALFVRGADVKQVLDNMLQAAIAIDNADMGNIQLLDAPSRTLRIVVHRGFEQPFLDFWNSVCAGQGTCGTAYAQMARVIVEDVTKSPTFVGTPALEVQLKAGVRAVQSTPLVSRSGKFLGIISTHHRAPYRPAERALPLLDLLARQTADIVERAQSEAERERLLQDIDAQRRLFQAVVENAPVGIAVLRGLHFVFDLINPSYQAIAPGKTLLGRTVAEAWPELADRVLPLLRQVLRTGEPFTAIDMQLPVQRVPEGAIEDLFFTYSYVPMRLAEGQTDSILVLVIETTEQVRARKRIEELAVVAERRAAELQGVLDNMVDGVITCDMSGRITMVNKAGLDLLGLASIKEIERPIAEFPDHFRMRHEDGRPVVPEELPLIRALRGETVVQEDEIAYNPRIQRDTYIRTSAGPIRDERGKIVGAVSVARDVTALTELDRLKDQFISVAAHELKTPVTIMKAYAQALLRAGEQVPAPLRKMLDAIDRGSDRIDRIVKDLLDISRLHVGHLELTVETIDLPEMVLEVIDRMALITTKHRIRLERAEPVVVQGDRDRLEQVLINLVDNATKYSPKGGDIDVAVDVRDHEAVVSIRDYGVGIPRGKQKRLFERFYRAHTGTPYDYGGMGVGLYISREIISRHGGRMWFESEEGKGSTFHFSLPLRVEAGT